MSVLNKLVCNDDCTGCELNISHEGEDVCSVLHRMGMIITNRNKRILLTTKPEGRWVCSHCYKDIELGENSRYTSRRVGRFDTKEQCQMHCYDHEREKAEPIELEEGVK